MCYTPLLRTESPRAAEGPCAEPENTGGETSFQARPLPVCPACPQGYQVLSWDNDGSLSRPRLASGRHGG